MIQPFGIRSERNYTPGKPSRDPEYLKFVRSFPCACGCGKTWGIEACHTGPHGISQKASDYTCIPLFRKCHREYDADPRGFAEKHGMNVAEIVMELNQQYQKRKKRTA